MFVRSLASLLEISRLYDVSVCSTTITSHTHICACRFNTYVCTHFMLIWQQNEKQRERVRERISERTILYGTSERPRVARQTECESSICSNLAGCIYSCVHACVVLFVVFFVEKFYARLTYDFKNYAEMLSLAKRTLRSVASSSGFGRRATVQQALFYHDETKSLLSRPRPQVKGVELLRNPSLYKVSFY